MPFPDSVLRDLDARLNLPARRRAMLLRELRADFEDLVETLEADGLSPEAARVRAMEMLVPTADGADALTGMHRPPYARMVAHLRPGRVHLAERLGIGAMAALAVLAPAIALARVMRLPTATLVVLGGVALALLANLTWQAFRIVVRDDADAASLGRAGMVQTGLVALTAVLGALMAVVQGYRTVGVWATLDGLDPGTVATAVVTCAATAALTLALTILGVFGALALLQWHLTTRGVERELVALLESAPLSRQE